MLDSTFKDEVIDGAEELIEGLEMADEFSLDEGHPFFVLLGGMAFDDGVIQNLIVPEGMPPAAVRILLQAALESDMLTESDLLT